MDRAQDATLTNRGTRQSERATRVMACTMTTGGSRALGPQGVGVKLAVCSAGSEGIRGI
jgi:hypothetical protein